MRHTTVSVYTSLIYLQGSWAGSTPNEAGTLMGTQWPPGVCVSHGKQVTWPIPKLGGPALHSNRHEVLAHQGWEVEHYQREQNVGTKDTHLVSSTVTMNPELSDSNA